MSNKVLNKGYTVKGVKRKQEAQEKTASKSRNRRR